MQVVVRLAPGSRVDQLSRVIARLHGAKAETAEMRFAGDQVVVTLADAKDLDRVRNVLDRVIDVVEVRVLNSVTSAHSTPRRTTYVPYIRKVS